MAIKGENTVDGSRRGQVWVAAGGLLGALAASSCCILPLVLFGLGIRGAWIGNLTQLAELAVEQARYEAAAADRFPNQRRAEPPPLRGRVTMECRRSGCGVNLGDAAP